MECDRNERFLHFLIALKIVLLSVIKTSLGVTQVVDS